MYFFYMFQLTVVPTTEPGVINFKVADTLQCRIVLNPQHLQSLHLKITPLPERKDVWSPEELQVFNTTFIGNKLMFQKLLTF